MLRSSVPRRSIVTSKAVQAGSGVLYRCRGVLLRQCRVGSLAVPCREELEYPSFPGALGHKDALGVPEATNLCLGSLVQNSVSHRRRLIDILEDGRAEYQNIQVFDFCTDTQRVTRILIFIDEKSA